MLTPKQDSPLLHGNSLGAKANAIFNLGICNFVSEGKLKIATNQLHTIFPDLKTGYAKQYEAWMDRAVADFIDKIDNMEPCVVFPPKEEDLYFDIKLNGVLNGNPREKLVRIQLFMRDGFVELLFNTLTHDNGFF